MPLPRLCTKCSKKFQPNGRYERLCPECRKEVKNVNFIKLIASRNNIDLNTINKNW